MSDTELFERFRDRAAKVLDKDPAAIVPDARFVEDLEADSLTVIELVMELEEEFDIEIPEEETDGIGTVGAAFDLVKSKL